MRNRLLLAISSLAIFSGFFVAFQNFSNILTATLSSGLMIPVGSCEWYAGNTLELCMQAEGNLVLYDKNSRALWATNYFTSNDVGGYSGTTADLYPCTGCYATFQKEGNLVLYRPVGSSMEPYWASGVGGYSGAQLQLTGVSPYLSLITSAQTWMPLVGGFMLTAGSCTPVANGMSLCMQLQGNLVLYNLNGTAVWATDFFTSHDASGYNGTTLDWGNCTECYATLQSDGNLVLYNPSFNGNFFHAYWASNTAGHPGASLTVLANSPFLALTDATGSILWAALPRSTDQVGACVVNQPTSPTILDFLNFPAQLQAVQILDQERAPVMRASNTYRAQSISYFGMNTTPQPVASNGVVTPPNGWYPNGFGQEIDSRTSFSYVPLWSQSFSDTFERHSPVGGSGYREIYLLDGNGMYFFLGSNAETSGKANAATCLAGYPPSAASNADYGSCDYSIVAGQLWAKNVAIQSLGTNNTYRNPFTTSLTWLDALNPASNGGMYGFMNGQGYPVAAPSQPMITANMIQTMSYAKMTYAQLVNLPLQLDVFGSRNGLLPNPLQGVAPGSLNITLYDAILVKAYSGCVQPDQPLVAPDSKCSVFEIHVYGRGWNGNNCAQPQPLGELMVLTGVTNGGQGEVVSGGTLVYNSH